MSTLTYADRQLVTAFVFLAKRGRGGASLNDLADALTLAHGSTSVQRIVDRLVALRVVAKVRMSGQKRAPWRLYAHIVAQRRCGTLTFEEWKGRHG